MKKVFLLLIISMFVLASCNKEEPEPTEPNKVYISSVVASPTASETVTLRNGTSAPVNLAGWTIGDLNNSTAYSIPSSNTIQPGAGLYFYASSMGFQINDIGETIYLKNGTLLIDTWSN